MTVDDLMCLPFVIYIPRARIGHITQMQIIEYCREKEPQHFLSLSTKPLNCSSAVSSHHCGCAGTSYTQTQQNSQRTHRGCKQQEPLELPPCKWWNINYPLSFLQPSSADEMKGKPWNVDKDASKFSSSSE